MFTFFRQSSKHLRLWLLAAAAVLLLTSVIEAGHVHGIFSDLDDTCTLCQHSVSLDKVLGTASAAIVIIVLASVIATLPVRVKPTTTITFSLIRAPPTQLPAR